MKLPSRHAHRSAFSAVSALALLLAGVASGCGSSAPAAPAGSTLPTREQAFHVGEVQINQMLIALHRLPTATFQYSEGLCNESDDQHGHVNVNYTIPGTYDAAQSTAALNSVESAMKALGMGTPVQETQPDGVYVQNAASGLLFDVDGGTLSFAYQSCYSTPAPADWWRANGLQALTVSPVPTSTAEVPPAVPTYPGSSLPQSNTSGSADATLSDSSS